MLTNSVHHLLSKFFFYFLVFYLFLFFKDFFLEAMCSEMDDGGMTFISHLPKTMTFVSLKLGFLTCQTKIMGQQICCLFSNKVISFFFSRFNPIDDQACSTLKLVKIDNLLYLQGICKLALNFFHFLSPE